MTLLHKGIDVLCKNDDVIDQTIQPRKNDIISLLEKYIKEIEIFNPALKLVGTNDTDELIIKHIIDSIAPAGILSRLLSLQNSIRDSGASAPLCENLSNKQIADIGSGAGLPGIPLAIAMHKNNFTLIERMGRRAGFLLNTTAVLALSNITIEERDVEKINSLNGFDLITFRAFLPLEPKLLKTLLKICAPNGIIAAYKGRRDKTEADIAQLMNTEYKNKIEYEIIPYTVPFLNEERCLLIIKSSILKE